MRVECEVEYVELENDHGGFQEGVKVTCSRCFHEEESYGTSDRSIRRCFVLMKENCPNGESNYYCQE